MVVTSSEPLAPAEGEPWCVCHARPRCEKKLAGVLEIEQIVHYLPLVNSVRRYHKQEKQFQKPLFPGYVFARIPLDKRPRVFQQELLARLLPVKNETSFLRQLAEVRALIASGWELSLRPPITKGVRVRVKAGGLYGLEGLVENPRNPNGIVIVVDVLRQGVHAKVPARLLEVIA